MNKGFTSDDGATERELRLLIERDNPCAPIARIILRERGMMGESQSMEATAD